MFFHVYEKTDSILSFIYPNLNSNNNNILTGSVLFSFLILREIRKLRYNKSFVNVDFSYTFFEKFKNVHGLLMYSINVKKI